MARQEEQPLGESQHPGQARLIPLTQWNQYHAWPPLGGLRHLVFHEWENGFCSVVKRVGRRVLIDEQAFFAWVDAQQEPWRDR
ncbi:MAG TPA: hypothetical protein PK251_13820 [Candidatus Latescibacteria bacterium]|nr:hypothetical protein [Candidatus Latescibacterota bacterium]HOS65819.1 hypothetical protein [Candidatus Latescibacterota bacterium]HPK75653.1 hypothetical protein [Candidatus Latescibacterota bacterium]